MNEKSISPGWELGEQKATETKVNPEEKTFKQQLIFDNFYNDN